MNEFDSEPETVLYRRSPELNELFAALAKAQGAFAPAEKAGQSNFGKHATLESVLEATKDGRQSNGLAIIQIPGNLGDAVAVTTILGHASGQWIESVFAVRPIKFDAQGAGSVVTYLRRYALMSVLGIAPEDDDGAAAVDGSRSAVKLRSPQRALATNGHALAAPPPHDPATGEIGPYTVPLMKTDRGPDFVKWGGLLIAGVKTSASLDDVREWHRKNAAAAKLAQGTPALKSVNAAFVSVEARFLDASADPDVIDEADAANILDHAR
jgi:hypothetical protein